MVLVLYRIVPAGWVTLEDTRADKCPSSMYPSLSRYAFCISLRAGGCLLLLYISDNDIMHLPLFSTHHIPCQPKFRVLCLFRKQQIADIAFRLQIGCCVLASNIPVVFVHPKQRVFGWIAVGDAHLFKPAPLGCPELFPENSLCGAHA